MLELRARLGCGDYGRTRTVAAIVLMLPPPAPNRRCVRGTCYHIDEPEAALREIARVLAPGGQFIHESPLAQLIAHPLRNRGRRLPWNESSSLADERRAVLWASRRKQVAT